MQDRASFTAPLTVHIPRQPIPGGNVVAALSMTHTDHPVMAALKTKPHPLEKAQIDLTGVSWLTIDEVASTP
jgi:hypothetical protein